MGIKAEGLAHRLDRLFVTYDNIIWHLMHTMRAVRGIARASWNILASKVAAHLQREREREREREGERAREREKKERERETEREKEDKERGEKEIHHADMNFPKRRPV